MQFVNVLDFMIVMPLGPDFSVAIGIASDDIGLLSAAYTGAAAVSGLLGSFFLDRFDRRTALGGAMLGLVIATVAGGAATGLWTMFLARAAAGAFGGPATALAFAIVADTIPVERRGRAIGTMMSAVSVASVLGVPLGLGLASWGGWRAPLFALGAMGLGVCALAIGSLPPLTAHLSRRSEQGGFWDLAGRPAVRLSWFTSALVFTASFILIPNISAYIQGNLHYPRAWLPFLYLAGGVASFGSTNLVGRLVDRYGSAIVVGIGAVLLISALVVGFLIEPPLIPVPGIFVLFMTAMSFRNVAFNTLAARIPGPHERARFQSIQSAVQHTAAALAATISSLLLIERPDRSLDGMPRVVAFSIALTLILPPLVWQIERQVKRPA